MFELYVEYPKKLHNFYNNLPFSPERMKRMIKKYIIYINNLKQELNHRLVLKKVHRVIKFNKAAWLKPYIDMNTELKKQNKII